MKKILYISLCVVALFAVGCQDTEMNSFDSGELFESSVVEVLEDGSLFVTATLTDFGMETLSVSSRAENPNESTISSTGSYALVFGVDPATGGTDYSDSSPLLQKVALTVNANGTCFMTFTPYYGVAFLRIVANLTTRERTALDEARAWSYSGENFTTDSETGVYYMKTPTTSDDLTGIGTFGTYKYQSVGLDGIYNLDGGYNTTYSSTVVTDENGVEHFKYDEETINTTQPNPNVTSYPNIPMSSVGYTLTDGITEDSMTDLFGSAIYMVRVCSKMDVTITDEGFTLYEVHMIDCAQEALVRSSVLTGSTSTDGETSVLTSFEVPIDLGGTINYLPLSYSGLETGETTSPIYFYPNSGGDYDSNDGAVDKTVNPQYVIIKGRAAGYDSDGYYKIALKGQYPLSYQYNEDGSLATEDGKFIVTSYSDLTYDIVRNTHFNIELVMVDKPGYKTYEDAIDPVNPANNISYNITIFSTDGRNEILVSKGTYYVELATTRVYMYGYGDEGTSGTIEFTLYPNTSDADFTHPATYVMADYDVTINSCFINNNTRIEMTPLSWSVQDDEGTFTEVYDEYYDDQDATVSDYWFKVPSSSSSTSVVVNYSATGTGRIRLRIGDILKFIPVSYIAEEFPAEGGQLVFEGDEDDFSFDAIMVMQEGDVADGELGAAAVIKYDVDVAEFLTAALLEENNDYNWFHSTGIIGENNTGSGREMRAKIYPKDADGITKVYLKQAASE